MIGVASAESTAIGDPLRARKNRGKTSGVVNWSGVDCPVARVWTSAEYIRARFVRFLMLALAVLSLAVRDGRERRSRLVLPPLRHPAPSSPTPSWRQVRRPDTVFLKCTNYRIIPVDYFSDLHSRVSTLASPVATTDHAR